MAIKVEDLTPEMIEQIVAGAKRTLEFMPKNIQNHIKQDPHGFQNLCTTETMLSIGQGHRMNVEEHILWITGYMKAIIALDVIKDIETAMIHTPALLDFFKYVPQKEERCEYKRARRRLMHFLHERKIWLSDEIVDSMTVNERMFIINEMNGPAILNNIVDPVMKCLKSGKPIPGVYRWIMAFPRGRHYRQIKDELNFMNPHTKKDIFDYFESRFIRKLSMFVLEDKIEKVGMDGLSPEDIDIFRQIREAETLDEMRHKAYEMVKGKLPISKIVNTGSMKETGIEEVLNLMKDAGIDLNKVKLISLGPNGSMEEIDPTDTERLEELSKQLGDARVIGASNIDEIPKEKSSEQNNSSML